ncbi:hypothetical protein C1H46_003561 [Malus baccata]|uniref:Uncharacterized protein n=1 Tax=Malus baccata TaxID=106549 RepID=A0A540NIK1_MALBA|nr:hypothetical protein C1H46_003561 [Malus baccata]
MVDSSPLDLNLAHGVSSGGFSSAPMRFPFQHHQVPGFGAVIGVPSSAAAAAKQLFYDIDIFIKFFEFEAEKWACGQLDRR